MQKGTKTRLWSTVCLLIVAAVCVINLAQTTRRVPPPPRYGTNLPANSVMRHEQRFARLREALKAHRVRGTIGYIADLPIERLRADAAAMEEYFLSQFALIPVLIDANVESHRWAVANLHSAKPADRVPTGFRIVEDFGDGVLLLRREER
jgi:hypothetical protein